MEIERRVQSTSLPELRDAGDGKSPKIVGHVALYNSWSPTYYGCREMIAPGFFDDVMGGDVPSLFNHDANFVLGRTTATPPTLRLMSTQQGLYAETDLAAESQAVRDYVVTPMRRGDIRGASFAFSIPRECGDRATIGEDGLYSRVLLKANGLYDVSPAVTNPYYPQTSMALRALAVARRGLEGKGAEIGDMLPLQSRMLLSILGDLEERKLTPKEVMLVSAAVGLLEELLPDDPSEVDDEPAPAVDPAAGAGDPGVSLYSLFGPRARRALRNRATPPVEKAPELPLVAPALLSLRLRLKVAERGLTLKA